MPAVLAELVVAIATEMVGVKVTVRAWRAEGASVGRLTERKETRAAVTMMIALEAAMAAAGGVGKARMAVFLAVVMMERAAATLVTAAVVVTVAMEADRVEMVRVAMVRADGVREAVVRVRKGREVEVMLV